MGAGEGVKSSRQKVRHLDLGEKKEGTVRKRKKKQTHKKASNKKSARNRYSKEESKKVEKYDILGSGNFEIIRGGILDKTKEEKGYKLKSESDQAKNRKIDKKDRPEETNFDYDVGNEEDGNGETDDAKSKEGDTNEGFEPFNFDLFGSDPMLGFQGYDNFDASKNDLTKVKV